MENLNKKSYRRPIVYSNALKLMKNTYPEGYYTTNSETFQLKTDDFCNLEYRFDILSLCAYMCAIKRDVTHCHWAPCYHRNERARKAKGILNERTHVSKGGLCSCI